MRMDGFNKTLKENGRREDGCNKRERERERERKEEG